MKKNLSVILLAGLTFFACKDYDGDIEKINSKLEVMENEKIADIKTQVSNILNSVNILQSSEKELRGYISTLQTQKVSLEETDKKLSDKIDSLETELKDSISVVQANVLAQLKESKAATQFQISYLTSSIDSLKNKDEELNNRIDTLTTYVDTQLNGNRDWIEATFVTLDKYNSTAEIVASIQQNITDINARIDSLNDVKAGISASDLNTAITNSETSIKGWINTQFTSYYTIAQIDTKLDNMKTVIDGQFETQKTYLTSMITSLETALNKKIEQNQKMIDTLKTRANGLDSDIADLISRITTNAGLIETNALNISTNSSKISTNSKNIDTCNAHIEANKKLIKENESAIEANNTAISLLRERMSTAESNILHSDTAILNNATAIAKNAQDITTNASLISSNATAISNNAQAISDNATSISQLRTDLATARTEITAAYKKAISDAIIELDGKLSGRIAKEVDTINARIGKEVATINQTITALTTRVATCEREIRNIKNTIYTMQQDIEDMQEQIAAILARVQSITYVPKYSDGKAVMTYTNNGTITPGTAVFDFELKPSATATELAAVWQNALSMKAVYTVTKAASEMVTLNIENVTADNGYLTVTVSGSGLKEAFFKSQCSANVRLSISDGNNDITTDYIQMVPWTTDVISFADAKFKTYCLRNFDTNRDGEISEDEAKAVTAINCSLANITSLVGVEYFSNLTSIDVSSNKLTSLDLSHSPKLTEVLVNNNSLQTLTLDGLAALKTIDCSSNKLTVIDVSGSPLLQTLNCNVNNIGALNLKNNKALTELQCNNNNIAALDLKNNTALVTLNCRKNELTVLSISKQTALTDFDCSANSLASINLYSNTLLENVYCASNNLSSLGLVSNEKLVSLDCSNNALTKLDITNNALLETLNCSNNVIGNLDVSQNAALTDITCTNNTQMAKLWVKDASQQNAMTIKKDNTTTVSFNNGGIVIPDANLKNYLLALFDDDEDGAISILESENIENVNCSGRGISDLTGLESCSNLKYLNFNNNSVATVNLPNLAKLETIVAYDNPINVLNVDNDVSLTSLYLQNVSTNAISVQDSSINITAYDQANSLNLEFAGTRYDKLNLTASTVLKTIDVTENVQLTSLDIHGNSLVNTIDVSTLSDLATLNCYDCALTTLDVDNNPELTILNCANNAISSLNVDNNTLLKDLQCDNNSLSTLKVANNTALTKLVVANNKLSNINVRKNVNLKELNVASNAGITALALGYNTALETLVASNTGLTDIDLRANLALQTLNLFGCSSMSVIDLSVNTALSDLNLMNTNIGYVDVTNLTSLIRFHMCVDLGLSVRWATSNIGADIPSDYGNYYAWGEIETKSNYDWSKYKYCNNSGSNFTKYCTNKSSGYNNFIDEKTTLELSDDVANVIWGGNCRMPTKTEYEELVNSDNCTWTWTTQNGKKGYKVTSKKSGYTDRSIFLPAAGYRNSTSLNSAGSQGYYWSSSLDTSHPYDAWKLKFTSGAHGTYDYDGFGRDRGMSVRPVCPYNL